MVTGTKVSKREGHYVNEIARLPLEGYLRRQRVCITRPPLSLIHRLAGSTTLKRRQFALKSIVWSLETQVLSDDELARKSLHKKSLS